VLKLAFCLAKLGLHFLKGEMHKYFFLIIFSSISVWGSDAVSNKELLAKIELISNRVKQLEQRIQSVKKKIINYEKKLLNLHKPMLQNLPALPKFYPAIQIKRNYSSINYALKSTATPTKHPVPG